MSDLSPRMSEQGDREGSGTRTTALSRPLLLLMAFACGMNVANIYYCQPLLAQMGHSLTASVRQIGSIPLLTQLGCACGMLLFVPMGDITERRALILKLLAGTTLALLLTAFTPHLFLLAGASFLIGLTSVVSHLLLPFAAQLAVPEQRGQAVGTVLSGLLIGILLARTVSGGVGVLLGWRAMYEIAAGVTVLLAALLRLQLPQSVPTSGLRYDRMLLSLFDLIRSQPVLRQASLLGALTFGAFSAFWSTLVFLLEGAPFHFHPASTAAGLFGLVGVVGAAAAPLAGRLADRYGPHMTLGAALLATVLSWGIFWAFGGSLWGLILGVILLDFGVQSAHVSNQTRIYALIPEARSRLNTIYMVSYFAGGSLGSFSGSLGWSLAQWPGVCLAGLALASIALLVFLIAGKR